MRVLPSPLYPILDLDALADRSPVAAVRELADGGARWLQFRGKQAASGEFYRLLHDCCEEAHARGLLVIVNDRVDAALAAGADGVHLGQTDLPPAEVGKFPRSFFQTRLPSMS